MSEWRPKSQKLRALSLTYGKPLDELVKQYAQDVRTLAEIATEWQARVTVTFPELGLVFNAWDVSRLFTKFGVRSHQEQAPADEPVAGATA